MCLVPGHSCPHCSQHMEVYRRGSRREVCRAGLWSGRRRQCVLVGMLQLFFYSQRSSYLVPTQSFPAHSLQSRDSRFWLENKVSLILLLGADPASWEEPARAFPSWNGRSFIYLHVSAAIAASEPLRYKQVLMPSWVRANVNLQVLSIKKGNIIT